MAGHLFIIAAPSGTGKTTLCRAMRTRFVDLDYSISHTTRQPRDGEKAGRDYFFITEEMFLDRIRENKWAEWAKVHGNYYGTAAAYLNEALASGRDVLLDIDVQGTIQILKRYPDAVAIFIMPPSMEALRERLALRGTDSADVVEKRLKNAREEIEKKNLFHHVVVNDDLPSAIAALSGILESYRGR
jgi:guanylate kinase